MRKHIFSSHFLVEMLISLFLLIIIFKLFIFEISHIQHKKNVLNNIKVLNRSYLAVTHMSNRCLGIGNTYKESDMFYGRTNSLLFFSFSKSKLHNFLKFKNVYYFYLFNNKIKEMINSRKGYPLNVLKPMILLRKWKPSHQISTTKPIKVVQWIGY